MREPDDRRDEPGHAPAPGFSGEEPRAETWRWPAASGAADEVIEVPAARGEAEPPPYRPRRWLPAFLFLATCSTTFLMGGPVYMVAVMVILTTHELGHWVQARRYGVPASLPYFIPMPLPPLGTLGAVIAMRARISGTRALFDIGITGPLAGLVPTLIFTVVGLGRSEIQPVPEEPAVYFGSPLLFDWLAGLMLGPVPEGYDVFLHPLAFAGWVGIFITALNLLPIGQLDGGHILYALLRERAHRVSAALLGLAALGIMAGGYWGWSLMLVLLVLMGPRHPPTSDRENLSIGRKLLGWLTLAFFFLGFTPEPFQVVGL